MATGEISKGDRPGATVSFEYDRTTVQRFRKAFPRARWDDLRNVWFVPGTTASRRIRRWLDLEASARDVYADARGRDAFAFEPILSKYLEPGDDIVIRTPYSRTVVAELQNVPFAAWDDQRRAWRVPYRSLDDLRSRWPTIEAAAIRNEPEEKRRRLSQAKATDEFETARQRAAERRRRRYPLPSDDLPPPERPVTTGQYGIIAFTEITGELADPEVVRQFYNQGTPGLSDLIWGTWRVPSLGELVGTWPSKPPDTCQRERGWWLPTKEELVAARKAARSRERRKSRTPHDLTPSGAV